MKENGGAALAFLSSTLEKDEVSLRFCWPSAKFCCGSNSFSAYLLSFGWCFCLIRLLLLGDSSVFAAVSETSLEWWWEGNPSLPPPNMKVVLAGWLGETILNLLPDEFCSIKPAALLPYVIVAKSF